MGETVGADVVGEAVGADVVGVMVGDLVGAAVGSGGTLVGDGVENVGTGVLRKSMKSGFVEVVVSVGDVTGAVVLTI